MSHVRVNSSIEKMLQLIWLVDVGYVCPVVISANVRRVILPCTFLMDSVLKYIVRPSAHQNHGQG